MLNETECKGSGNKTYAEPSNKTLSIILGLPCLSLECLPGVS